jgi:hypothetical protein
MGDQGKLFSVEALKAAEKARLMQQFEREFEREWAKDWAEAERLAAKYPGSFVIIAPGGSRPQQSPRTSTTSQVVSAPIETPLGPVGIAGSLTVKALIDAYKSDANSGYHKIAYKTRESYGSLLRRIESEMGLSFVANIDGRRIKEKHQEWSASGHIAMAHSLVTMLRTLSTFGATWLNSPECRDLKVVLSGMEFPTPPPRSERLTIDHVNAIRAKAHESGFHSIALAQAFQFDCRLAQKDVIGEWVPQSEPGVSDVFDGDMKWLRGLRWSEIDDNLVLTHPTLSGGKASIWRLTEYPMVMAEFDRLGARGQNGPIIKYETTGKPYNAQQFRWMWRKVATAAGVSKKVFNMDSRGPARLDRVNPERRSDASKETDSAL